VIVATQLVSGQATTALHSGSILGDMGEGASKRSNPTDDDAHDLARQGHVELFERARNGDVGAWRELTKMFTPLVERLARQVCRSSADVDDVVQEVWLLLLRNLDKIRSPACLPGWLQRVAKNAALRHIRAQRAQPYADLPEECVVGEDEAGLRLSLCASQQGVQHALRRLTEADRRLLALLMAEDRPDYAKISRDLDRPIGSIGPTRQRLLRQLSHDPAIVRLAAS